MSGNVRPGQSATGIVIKPSRLTGSIPVIATLLIAGLGVAAPTSAARATDCLAAPNSPAPEGRWWYYRLDRPTQRKCWHLRSLGKPAQQTTERAATGSASTVRSRSAQSDPIRSTDRAPKSTTHKDTTPSSKTAPVGSIEQEVPAPQVSPLMQTTSPTKIPAPTAPPLTSTSSEPIVEQNAHEEITTQSIPERPVQETSAPSQPNTEAAAPGEAAGVASPDAVPRIEALDPTSVEPATTSAINCLGAAPGKPVCVDRNTLAAMLLAGLLTSDPELAATPGCQTLPSDAKLELLERQPGVFPFMRMIKVKVTSPTKLDLTVGFTIEMGPLGNEGFSSKAPQ
jgi:hypothetical protein